MTAPVPAFSNVEAPTAKRAEAETTPAVTQGGLLSGTKPPPKAERADTGTTARDGVRGKPDAKSDYRLVPIDDLHEDPDNPRKTFRLIGELAQSLKVEGMLQPVVARINTEGKLIIMWGHRRVRAAKVAGWTEVPTIIRYNVKDSSILAKQLIENSHRDDLDPLDEARGIRYYMRENRIATYAECAIKLGHSLAWVAGRVALLDLDQEDQDLVSSGELKIMDAVKLARKVSGKTRVSKKQREADEEQAEKFSPVTTRYIAAHFNDEHPLAGRAKSRCDAYTIRGEIHKPVLSNTACGFCWEAVIRADAKKQFEAELKAVG